MNDIDNLLRRYQEGNLTPGELAELNELTHKDRVFESACREAKTIRRRRVSAVVGVAVVVMVVGLSFVHPPMNRELVDSPMVAQVDAPQVTTGMATDSSVDIVSETKSNELPVVSRVRQQDSGTKSPALLMASAEEVERPAAVESDVVETLTVVDDLIVACNSQCSPDSVINDIWKFLRT